MKMQFIKKLLVLPSALNLITNDIYGFVALSYFLY